MKQSVLVVFSHLRWGFVFQRPQHLLSRLAQFHRIVFIEEPIVQPGDAALRQYEPAPNVTVIEPHTDVAARTSVKNTGFITPAIAFFTAFFCKVMPARTVIRRAVLA